MKNKFLLLFLFLIVFGGLVRAEIILEYRNETIMLPNSNETISVFITNTGSEDINANISCESALEVFCPNEVVLKANSVMTLKMFVKSSESLGYHYLNFSINEYKGGIRIKVSTIPSAVETIIGYYEDSLKKMKEDPLSKYVPEINDAELKLMIAKELWENGLYYESANKLEEVHKDIEKAAEALATRKVEELKKESNNESTKKSDMRNILSTIFFIVLIFLVLWSTYYLMCRMMKLCGREMSEHKFVKELMIVKDKVGKVESKEFREITVREVEKRIEKLRRMGEDVSELEIDLALIKRLKRDGKELLAQKYLERLAKRLEWDIL